MTQVSRPTLRDVAAAAGVSIGSASRVLNANTSVASAIRQKVERAIEELGYEPNALARSMRVGSTRTVGVAVRDITIPIFADFVQGIQESLDDLNYSLLIACSKDQIERELSIVRVFGQRKIDGLIMTTSSEDDRELVEARRSLGAPIIFMDRAVVGDYSSVLISHRAGTREAVEHLLDLGHRNIGLITGASSLLPGRERTLGYCDAFAARGLTPPMEFVRAEGFQPEICFSHAMELMSRKPRATAIIAGGFSVLAEVLRAARLSALSIPRDISVIAGANSEFSQLFNPPISAISFDMKAIGKAAVSLLVNRLTGISAGPKDLTFPAELSIRNSCAAPIPVVGGRGVDSPEVPTVGAGRSV